ncbi:exodeoxyribonuclease III [Rhodoblastus sp.]|uniref:exodeoxyribonuclease III n=1 Tax=Rhodoblastus sp. TaxID=1962975 RepID=UPI003F9A7AAA
MQLKITTWNINSVRLRFSQVATFLAEHEPDVLCLQETKCRDAEFPASDFRKLGYEHLAISGQKGYHGVAIVSRLPLQEVERRNFCQIGDARHISARVSVADKSIRVDNFYVPAGGDKPDVQINPKFAHKLSFLDELDKWISQDSFSKNMSLIVGDLNIAHLENDVWDHRAMLKEVSHTPPETDKLKQIIERGNWIDTLRRFTPDDQKLYTWWSYRSPNWAAADKGRRLDHIWASQPLEPYLQNIEILREARGWERPSDHVPVSLVLKF